MKNYFSDIPTCEWEDLEGKTLLIRVSEDLKYEEDKKVKILYGYDPIDNMMYVLAEKII